MNWSHTALVIIILNEREMSWKWHKKGPLRPFYHQLVNVSILIQTHVHASSYRLSFRYSLLVPFSPLGCSKTLFLIMYQNSSGGRGLLSSLGIKKSKALCFLEPAAASISKTSVFACFPLLVQKALWHSSNLKWSRVISCSLVFYLW